MAHVPPERYVTRFAPSPTGLLHLGHAYSALTAFARACDRGGRFMLRIEDLDSARSKAEYAQAIFDDLGWLGLVWEAPVLRQSARMDTYASALNRLISLEVCYPCACTRGDIRAALSAPQEGAPVPGPDGLVYPGTCRDRPMADAGPHDAIRLDMARALDLLGGVPDFTETGPLHGAQQRPDGAHMLAGIGDVALARRDIGTSYHLAVVVDDAAQGITEVVRGDDLFEATPIHRVLQALLGLPAPAYHHHALVRDAAGRRLAKRDDSRAIRRYRDDGLGPEAVARLAGFTAPAP